MLRKTLPWTETRSISTQDKRTTFVAFFKKTVAYLKNFRARWKTRSFRDNEVFAIVITPFPSPWGAFGGLSPPKQTSKPPKLKRETL